jgi:sodium-dependent dicarboxylate transporter 2/3/5
VFINLLGVVVITLLFYLIGTRVFSIDPGVFPEWAESLAPAD